MWCSLCGFWAKNARDWQFAAVLLLGVAGLTFSAFAQTSWRPPALLARNRIGLNGNGIYTDSYNSLDPNKSTNGKYDSAKYSGDFGDITITGNPTNFSYLDLGNAAIYGSVHVGPTCSVSMGYGGGVGPHGAQATNISQAYQLGYIIPDANFTFPDTTLPATTGWAIPPSGWVVTNGAVAVTVVSNSVTYPDPPPPDLQTNWDKRGKIILGYSWLVCVGTNFVYGTNFYKHIIFPHTNYCCPTNLSGGTIVLGPNATLVLPNGLNQLSGDSLTFVSSGTSVRYSFDGGIAPTNWTSLSVASYPTLLAKVGGTSASIAANQVVNPSGFAGSFILFCAPSVTSLFFLGSATFTGVLVAPNAALSLNLGGGSFSDFCGSLMVYSATVNGHFAFHYDEALSTGDTFPLPWITAQPQDQTALEGQDATLSVTAIGSPPLNYQWFSYPFGPMFPSPILGATNSTLTLTNVGWMDVSYSSPSGQYIGLYSVVVSNALGTQTSQWAELTVLFPPSIGVQPVSQAAVVGSNVTFTVWAGATTPSYQWAFNGADLPGATNYSLTLSNIQMANAGDYLLSISNAYGFAVSSPATLSVVDLQPSSLTALAGQNARFNVLTAGASPLSYQWQFNGTNISDATGDSLLLSSVTTDQAGPYSVQVTVSGVDAAVVATANLSVHTSAAANLDALRSSNDSEFGFAVGGVTGFRYAVEGSTNLSDWVPLTTNTAPFTFLDAEATNYPQRYYRSVWLP